MRIVILATEPSGDFLGSKLIKNLKKNKKVVISGVGGEQMKVEGFQSWVTELISLMQLEFLKY